MILIATDHGGHANGTCASLESFGYKVQITDLDEDVWALILDHKPDLIILTTQQPSADSLTICARIKREETLGFLPVVMLTANADEAAHLAIIKSGVDDHLVSPVENDTLRVRVQALLSTKKRFDILTAANQKMAADLAAQNQQLEAALQTAEELDILRSAIVRNIGHEMRTPLLQVKSAVSLLEEVFQDEQPDPHNTLTLLSMAVQATARLEDTVSRITQLISSQNLKEEPVALDESIDLAIREIERSWAKKEAHKRIKKCYEDDLSLVLGDTRGIAQVLRLLLDNALKFSPDDKPVEVVLTSFDEDTILVSVRDYGIGIAKDQHGQIFELLYQVDLSGTRKFGGAGVGLTLARLLARKMNTDVTVESKPKQGSTFSFVLPVARLSD